MFSALSFNTPIIEFCTHHKFSNIGARQSQAKPYQYHLSELLCYKTIQIFRRIEHRNQNAFLKCVRDDTRDPHVDAFLLDVKVCGTCKCTNWTIINLSK